MMATSGDVLRKVEAMWRDTGEQARVQQELERYGQEGHERERERVQLAILKLCESRVDKVAELVELAKQDYRDVLVWAEYPEEGRALWACQPHLSEAEQTRLDEIRRRDQEQYRAWLKGQRLKLDSGPSTR